MLVCIAAPAENTRGPRYMQEALAAIHQSNPGRSAMSFLYGSHEGRAGLYCEIPEDLAALVLPPLRSKYPDCCFTVLENDAALEPPLKSVCETWSLELILTPELFPILRHSQFEDIQSGTFEDPIDTLLQSITPDDQSHAHIEVRLAPTSRRRRRRARRAVKWLDSPRLRAYETRADLFARCAMHRVLWPLAWLSAILAPKQPVFTRSQTDTTGGRQHEREDDVQAASDKVGGHLFDVRIRLVVHVPEGESQPASRRLGLMSGAVGSFTVSRLATFRVAGRRRGPVGSLRSNGFLMSHEELATLCHPPTASVRVERMHKAEHAELEAPVLLPSGENEAEVVVGRVKFRGDRRTFGIGQEDRRRHLYVVGKTGMGKTTLLYNQIAADIAGGRGLALIDPHGDLADALLGTIPTHRTNDVIAFDAADAEFAVSFNPLACSDPAHVDRVSSGVVSAFKKLYDSWGPRLEDTLRNAVFAMVEQNGNLLSLLRLLSDEAFRTRTVAAVQDEVVRAFWLNEFAHWNDRYRTEAVAAIQNKIRPFLTNRLLRAIVAQGGKSLDLRRVMDNGHVLLVNLSKGRTGEDNATLLGALLVTAIQQAALSRADVAETDRRDFCLYVDEFQSFTTGAFATILSEARKFRLSLTMAHQYIGQLDEQTAEAVFGNVGSMIVFQVGSEDAELLAPQLSKFPGQVRPQDLTNLPKYTAYARLLIDGQPSPPFSMETIPRSAPSSPGRQTVVRQASRRRYATPVASMAVPARY